MTESYTELTHDQLLSAITERDEQLRVAESQLMRAKQLYEQAQLDVAVELKSRQEYQGQAFKLDQQLRMALVEVAKVNGFRDDLQRKYQTLRDKYSEACSHLESSQERCKVCEGLLVDERNNTKSLLTTHKTVLKECVSALKPFECETCNGTHKFKFECPSCLSGEGSCTCDKQEAEPCPQCQSENGLKEVYANLESSTTHATALLEGSKGEV